MTIKKGLCPHCGSSKNLKEHIINVNMDNPCFVCPHCGKKFKVFDATNKLDEEYVKYLNKAGYKLHVKADASEAYKEYGVLLNIDNENIDAHFGRMVSLIYCSKMHKSFINEAISLFKIESINLYRKSSDKQAYLKFLTKVNFALSEYVSKIRKALQLKGCFYDVDCLKVYYSHLSECIEMQRLLVDEVEFLSKHYDKKKTCSYSMFLNNDVEEKTKLLNACYRTVDGNLYSLDTIKNNGEVVLTDHNNKIDTKLSKYRMATFDVNNKELRHINETVFKNNTSKIVFCNLSLVLMIIFTLGSASLITLGTAYGKGDLTSLLFLIAGIVCAVLTVGFTISFALLTRFIKKRKTRIN